jgi:hypothetical protein
LYLIKYQKTHDLLHTITDINPAEWEILTSGRFDGFLWSGADSDDVLTPTAEDPQRGQTPVSGFFPPASGATASPFAARFTTGIGVRGRNATPLTPFSRGTTPSSFVSGGSTASGFPPSRPAVSNDEEMEIAVLAELEREIFAGMEALEDVFEALHSRAETVRAALRQRSAGLSMSLQQRRGGSARVGVLPMSAGLTYDRPGWATGDDMSMTSESDWGGGDDVESLAPDDSASNISSSKHRRPKRRSERYRRTPALVEEPEE